MEVPSDAPITVATPGRRQGGDIPQAVEIASYGEGLVRLVLHLESKMLGPGLGICKVRTKGLLTPIPVRVAAVHLVGKEGNKVEEVATDEVTDPDEVLIDYGDDAWERLVLPVGRVMGICTMALETGLARSMLIDLFQGRSSPQAATRALVTGVVASWVGSKLSTCPGRDQL
jgi:hypothetical protein